jgi:hypothetical protein
MRHATEGCTSEAEADVIDGSRRGVVWLAVAVEGGMVAVALLLGWWLGLPPLATLTWDTRHVLLGLAGTLPMLALFFACLRWPVGPLRGIEQFCDEVIRPLLGPCTLAELLVIALLAGLGEEMLFRGVAQAGFARWWQDPWVGLALASVLFGLCHAITAAYVVLAALMGVYLGWLWLWSGNLLTPVVTHAVYDFVALVVLLRFRKGPPAA